MIFAVATVKDTLSNVERFVTGCINGGVDHLVVFLDGHQAEVMQFLRKHPHVTAVQADQTWWRGKQPKRLNDRQCANANVVNAILSELPWAEWLFHVDGDEVVWLDRAVMDRVPAQYPAVRLAPLEAVAQHSWPGDPSWFKRLLTPRELSLLHAIGVINKPKNGRYFNGHTSGKVGIRPDASVWLAIHGARDVSHLPCKNIETNRLRCCTSTRTREKSSCANG